MKITVLQQYARGLAKPMALHTSFGAADNESLERCLESVRHYLWHGNSVSALDRLRVVADALEGWDWEDGEQTPQRTRALRHCT